MTAPLVPPLQMSVLLAAARCMERTDRGVCSIILIMILGKGLHRVELARASAAAGQALLLLVRALAAGLQVSVL